MSLIKLYKDSCTVEFDESVLDQKECPVILEGSYCPIAEFGGLTWSVTCNPTGHPHSNTGRVTASFNTSQCIGGNYWVTVKNTDIKHEFTFNESRTQHRKLDIVDHFVLRHSNAAENKKFVIQFNVEIIVPIGNPPSHPRAGDLFTVQTNEIELIADNGKCRVNRSFLKNISAVLSSLMLSNDEGFIKVPGFDVKNVQKFFDYCKGEDMGRCTMEMYIEMFKFSLKYEIPAVTKKLEAWMIENLNTDTVPPIADFAWEYSQETLLVACARNFFYNRNELTINPDFVKLNPDVIGYILKRGLTVALETL